MPIRKQSYDKCPQILLGSEMPVDVFVKCVILSVFRFIKAENLDLPSLKSNVFKKLDKTWLWQQEHWLLIWLQMALYVTGVIHRSDPFGTDDTCNHLYLFLRSLQK